MFAKRDAIEAEIREEEARLADLEEARYVRGEFTSKGRRGARFVGEERCAIQWAKPAQQD